MRLLDGRSVPPGRLLCCLKKINRAIVSASKRQDERTSGARGTGPNARTLILSRGARRLRPVLQNPCYREPTARDIGLDAGVTQSVELSADQGGRGWGELSYFASFRFVERAGGRKRVGHRCSSLLAGVSGCHGVTGSWS